MQRDYLKVIKWKSLSDTQVTKYRNVTHRGEATVYHCARFHKGVQVVHFKLYLFLNHWRTKNSQKFLFFMQLVLCVFVKSYGLNRGIPERYSYFLPSNATKKPLSKPSTWTLSRPIFVSCVSWNDPWSTVLGLILYHSC